MPEKPIPKPSKLPVSTSRGVCAFNINRADITRPANTMRIVVGMRRMPPEILFKGSNMPMTPQIAALWMLTL